jgi:phosphatidylglycerophosphatase A
MKQIAFLLSTLFYVGYFPKIPGTIGSLVSLPIIFYICYKFGFIGLLATIIISFIVAMVSVKEVLKYTKHDPSFVVIDEFIGQSVTFLLISDTLVSNTNIVPYIIGFILFRIFDVTKPYPVSYADKKIQNAFGVILDDVFAGIYATIIIYIISYLVKGF